MENIKVSLIGNPNSGKSTLFNRLTGLNQKIGNFPGVTVEKKTGVFNIANEKIEITDFPGIYSIFPRSPDESIVSEALLSLVKNDSADKIVITVDVTNLKRGLLLVTQIIDLGLPTILVLNMMDLALKSGVIYDYAKLSRKLGVPVIPINARNGEGVAELRNEIARTTKTSTSRILMPWKTVFEPVELLQKKLNIKNDYLAYLYLEQRQSLNFLLKAETEGIEEVRIRYNFFPGKFQGAETIERYSFIQNVLNEITIKHSDDTWKTTTNKIDKLLTHKIYGYLIFFVILFLIFQAIYPVASVPMDFIDAGIASIRAYLGGVLPPGPLFSLLNDGIIPGIGGVLIFIPQIALLFACITLLEESGYMARVVFIMDRIMKKFGLNGKSVVPLMSGTACAIPAIMATRVIDNWKERTITILVTPLMSCSARLPIFTILIALIVPDKTIFFFFNLQGLALMSLYLLGFIAAIGSAWVMKKIINAKERSFLIMEMPTYKLPKLTNIWFTVYEKTKSFVFEAGKIILAISIILWGLASYGPGDLISNAEENVKKTVNTENLSEAEINDLVASYKLEHSFAGVIGKAIEPVIRPLGYDWKIGIALLTSFAAREVFVGTMATIYSIESTDDYQTIKDRLAAEINPDTNQPRFSIAVGASLLVFYTFAMQCMSTLAVVYRETKTWKWPLIQLLYMSFLAYFSAFVVYQTLS